MRSVDFEQDRLLLAQYRYARPHHDLTGDLVFPAMLDVADREMQRRDFDVLPTTPTFWTRTAAAQSPLESRTTILIFGIRPMGGIWPNLTVWVSYANRKLYPIA